MTKKVILAREIGLVQNRTQTKKVQNNKVGTEKLMQTILQ